MLARIRCIGLTHDRCLDPIPQIKPFWTDYPNLANICKTHSMTLQNKSYHIVAIVVTILLETFLSSPSVAQRKSFVDIYSSLGRTAAVQRASAAATVGAVAMREQAAAAMEAAQVDAIKGVVLSSEGGRFVANIGVAAQYIFDTETGQIWISSIGGDVAPGFYPVVFNTFEGGPSSITPTDPELDGDNLVSLLEQYLTQLDEDRPERRRAWSKANMITAAI